MTLFSNYAVIISHNYYVFITVGGQFRTDKFPGVLPDFKFNGIFSVFCPSVLRATNRKIHRY